MREQQTLRNIISRGFKWIVYGTPKHITHASIYQTYPQERLKGKKIIITGGGRGIGLYIAKKCLSEGAEVLITGRDEETLHNASVELGNCPYITLNMQNTQDFPSFIHEANEKLHGINCLINNAGISLHEHSFLDVTPEGFENQINTNLRGPYFLSQAFLTYLQSQKVQNANIIFITSERGLYCDTLPYGLTKAAINSLTAGLARRYMQEGIRVNAIAPGVTASDMTRIERDDNFYRENSCGKRVFLPEEVAEVTCFILSEPAACINGHVIPCNQGNHLRSDY